MTRTELSGLDELVANGCDTQPVCFAEIEDRVVHSVEEKGEPSGLLAIDYADLAVHCGGVANPPEIVLSTFEELAVAVRAVTRLHDPDSDVPLHPLLRPDYLNPHYNLTNLLNVAVCNPDIPITVGFVGEDRTTILSCLEHVVEVNLAEIVSSKGRVSELNHDALIAQRVLVREPIIG